VFFGYENLGNNWDAYNALLGITTVSAGRWYHAAFTYTHSTRIVRIYLDGVEEYSVVLPTATPDTSAVVQIATDGYKEDYFDGLIDDVKIYNRALNANEILAIATQ